MEWPSASFSSRRRLALQRSEADSAAAQGHILLQEARAQRRNETLSRVNTPSELEIKRPKLWQPGEAGPALTHISIRINIRNLGGGTTAPPPHQASACLSGDASSENASWLNSGLVICCWKGRGGGGEGMGGVVIVCAAVDPGRPSEMPVAY